MPHNKDTPIEVIQADRDAAADLYGHLFPWTDYFTGARCAEIRAGKWDMLALVQAFARHRLAHSPTPIDPSDEQVERLMREFYLSPSYDPKAARHADTVKAAMAYALRSPVPRELPIGRPCPSSPGSVCVVDTSMEAGSNHCFDCGLPMPRHLIQKERSQ